LYKTKSAGKHQATDCFIYTKSAHNR